MLLTRLLGVLGALCAAALVVGTIPALLELSTGSYVVAAAAAFGVVVLLVAGTTLVGRRSDRWTDNPYW